ncbi:hypothetical protein AB0G71_22375 [Streptomyces sp. NPDC020403]|uniref:hypothetical protein n=1 Tax=unclassified Streptomyces TaxID=2593676 RepID=UPI0033D994AA
MTSNDVTQAETVELSEVVPAKPVNDRLVDVLAAAGPKALTAIRTARAGVRQCVRESAGAHGPAAEGGVIVHLHGVPVLAYPEKQDATATGKTLAALTPAPKRGGYPPAHGPGRLGAAPAVPETPSAGYVHDQEQGERRRWRSRRG